LPGTSSAANDAEVPRTPRDDVAGAVHHVIAKGSGGESIVRDDLDRQALVSWLSRATALYHWHCLAYCILDTHFHLLVATPAANLGRGMQQLLSTYARDFNRRYERQGNLFHTRFWSRRVASDEHLRTALVYVLLNPVRAGLVERADRWPWGSGAATLGTSEPPAFLDVHSVLELIHEDDGTARIQLGVALAEASARDRSATPGVRRRV
jgi:REP element-mobilizing transposase RayT